MIKTAALPLPWRTSRAELKPHDGDGPQLPAVFSVNGRDAAQHFIEFGGPFPCVTLEAREYVVRIEATLGHRTGWRPLIAFILHADRVEFPEQYVTYSNEPVDRSDAQRARTAAALAEVMRKVDEVRRKGAPLSGVLIRRQTLESRRQPSLIGPSCADRGPFDDLMSDRHDLRFDDVEVRYEIDSACFAWKADQLDARRVRLPLLLNEVAEPVPTPPPGDAPADALGSRRAGAAAEA